ncbi:hypothetical protein VNI00_010023 [Paramarasmius palmivorus]|uniref:Cytochrome P450 n=1 Tax=Paramarasmius palmivorus TaxID=297713 RepID=A0AAW0CN63_9AGAR
MTWTTSVVILLVSLALARLFRIGKRESYLPPGPPTLPVVGNMHVFPTKYPHYKFTEWARQYGGMYSIKVGSQTVIVLNAMDHVKELLEKRNATTAGRPRNHVVEMVGKGNAFSFISANSTWRRQRKIANTILVPSVMPNHLPLQYAEASQTLYDILKTPEELCDHLSRYSFSVITSLLYGKRCPRSQTREVTAFYELQHVWTRLISPGTVPPVDKWPIFGVIPERWAPWKTLIRECQQRQRELYLGLLEECEGRVKKNEASECFIKDLLGRMEEHEMDRETLGYFAATLLEAGSETTSSVLKSLVLFLAASPGAQHKAFAEINLVVGDQRAPALEDLKHLPYLDAVLKEVTLLSLSAKVADLVIEVQRIRPAVPLALPHETTAPEEVCDCIDIGAGNLTHLDASILGTLYLKTLIFPNTYAINHDPGVYWSLSTAQKGCRVKLAIVYFDDPGAFRPERYLLTEHGIKPGVDDRSFRADIGFGFGRRICPGMHLAKNSIALVAMNLIWAFEFKPLVDPDTGKDIPVDVFAYEEGLSFTPKPFRCRVSPRNEQVVDMIRHQYRAATGIFIELERGLAPEDKEWIQEVRKNW